MHLDGWTLALQTLNLVVLLALLRWLFYRPLTGVVDARRRALADERAKADAARRELEQQSRDLAADRAAIEASRRQVIDEARQSAERDEAAAADRARTAATAALAEAKKQIEREHDAAQQSILEEASTLALLLAKRLLAQSPVDADAGFLAALIDRTATAQADERARWFGAATPRSVTVACASQLGAEAQAKTTQRLRALLGADLQITYVTDAALIAGAELRFAYGTLARHWAADLAAARAQMQDAAKAVA